MSQDERSTDKMIDGSAERMISGMIGTLQIMAKDVSEAVERNESKFSLCDACVENKRKIERIVAQLLRDANTVNDAYSYHASYSLLWRINAVVERVGHVLEQTRQIRQELCQDCIRHVHWDLWILRGTCVEILTLIGADAERLTVGNRTEQR